MQIGMRLLTSGQLKLENLITHSYELHDIQKAFEAAYEKPEGFVKAIVSMRR